MKLWYKKKKIPIPVLPENTFGYTVWTGSYGFIILNPDRSKKYWDAVGTIIHESVHIYQACMKYIGESATGIEMEAYTIETIATNLLKDYDCLSKKI